MTISMKKILFMSAQKYDYWTGDAHWDKKSTSRGIDPKVANKIWSKDTKIIKFITPDTCFV